MEYRRHPKYKDYLLYEDGSIFSEISKKTLKPQDNGNGYLKITIHDSSLEKPTQQYIHTLMLESWIGPCPEGHSVDHINRNKKDNSISNLRYVTYSENTKNTAGYKRYSANRTCKHIPEDIKTLVVELYNSGKKVVEISNITNVSRQSVSRFIKQKK